MKPFSQASENNKEPIARVLAEQFPEPANVLEIGSGTGQHAVFFATRLPHLRWQTSDLAQNHAGINAWLESCESDSVLAPIELDVDVFPWPTTGFDGVFSANTAHIMHWSTVENLFAGVGQALTIGGKFLLYGPFNFGGEYTSESNARFDAHLRSRDPLGGIRDFEALDELAIRNDLRHFADLAMPANNRILVWERIHSDG